MIDNTVLRITLLNNHSKSAFLSFKSFPDKKLMFVKIRCNCVDYRQLLLKHMAHFCHALKEKKLQSFCIRKNSLSKDGS